MSKNIDMQESQQVGFLAGDLEREGCPTPKYRIAEVLKELDIGVRRPDEMSTSDELYNLSTGESVTLDYVRNKLLIELGQTPSNGSNSVSPEQQGLQDIVNGSDSVSPQQQKEYDFLVKRFGKEESEIRATLNAKGLEIDLQGGYMLKDGEKIIPVDKIAAIGEINEHYRKPAQDPTSTDSQQSLNMKVLADSFQVPETTIVKAMEKNHLMYTNNFFTQTNPQDGKDKILENHQVLDIIGEYIEADSAAEEPVVIDPLYSGDNETTQEVVIKTAEETEPKDLEPAPQEPVIGISTSVAEMANSAVKRVVGKPTESPPYHPPSDDTLERDVTSLDQELEIIKKQQEQARFTDTPPTVPNHKEEKPSPQPARMKLPIPQYKNGRTHSVPPRKSPSRKKTVAGLEGLEKDPVSYQSFQKVIKSLAQKVEELAESKQTIDDVSRDLSSYVQDIAKSKQDIQDIASTKQRAEEYLTAVDKAVKAYRKRLEGALDDALKINQAVQVQYSNIEEAAEVAKKLAESNQGIANLAAQSGPVKDTTLELNELVKLIPFIQELAKSTKDIQDLAKEKEAVKQLNKEYAKYLQEPIQGLDNLKKVMPHIANVNDSIKQLNDSVLTHLADVNEDVKKYFTSLGDSARESLEGVLKGYTARLNPSLKKIDDVTQVFVQEIEKIQGNYFRLRKNIEILTDRVKEGYDSLLAQYATQGKDTQNQLNQLAESIGIKVGEDGQPVSLRQNLADLEKAVRKSRGSKLGRAALALTFLAAGAFGGGYLLDKYTNIFKDNTTQADAIAKTQYKDAVQENQGLQNRNAGLRRDNTKLTKTIANSNYARIKRDPRQGRKIMIEKVKAAGGKLRVYGSSCKGVFSNFFDLMVTEEQAKDVAARKKFVETDYNRRGICENFDPKKGYIKFEIK